MRTYIKESDDINYSHKPNPLIYFLFPYIILILLYLKTSYFRYITFASVLLFLVVFSLYSNKIEVKNKYLYFAWFIMAYSLIGLANGEALQIFKNLCMVVLNLTPFFVFDWLFSHKQENKRIQNSKTITKLVTILLIYTILATLYYLAKDPYVARNMANYDPSMKTTTNLPIAIGGGYTLIYGIVLLPPTLLYFGKYSKGSYLKSCVFIIIALFILFVIIKSGFATAFVVSLTGCLLAILFKYNRRFLNLFWVFTLIFILIFVFLNVDILGYLISLITNYLPQDSIISVRLNEIIPTLYGTSNDVSSFSIRLKAYQKTISSFLSSPIIGVGYKVGYDYIKEQSYTGLHTEWLDILSQYGLLIGLPLLMFIGSSLKQFIKLFKDTSMELIAKITVFIIILLGFLNPMISTSIFVISMIYLPCIFTLASNFED